MTHIRQMKAQSTKLEMTWPPSAEGQLYAKRLKTLSVTYFSVFNVQIGTEGSSQGGPFNMC